MVLYLVCTVIWYVYIQLPTVPYHPQQMALRLPTVPHGADLVMFVYKICPYCCKAKALLNFHRVSYAAVEVSPLTKRQIKWSQEYKKVPIAVFADGSVLNDSGLIIDRLLQTNEAQIPKEFASAEARQWASWSTDRLAVLMYPNLTRTFAECRQTLAYFSEAKGIGMFDAFMTRTLGAFGMSMAHGKIKKKYNIQDERVSLQEALNEWEAALSKSSGIFRGGNQPDLGDISVWGVLQAANGLPLLAELKSNGTSKFKTWMIAMEDVVPKPKLVEVP